MFRELALSHIRAAGWVREFLNNQARGLTGQIGTVGAPFSLRTWGFARAEREKDAFLGGMATIDNSWVPYEQTAYWIDGAVRAGHLADLPELTRLAQSRIYPTLELADRDGYLGPDFLKNGTSWAHAVYFRALIAEYSATGDERILDGLKEHFLRRPLKQIHGPSADSRRITVRNVADIETALWIYGQTGDERFLTMSEESYEEFNRIYQDDTGAEDSALMHDVTLPGMLANKKVKNNHGVTYCEVCKLAAILHLYTGKDVYKKAAVNAFDKLVRDQMLIDGVFSSTEYLNGNSDSHAMHETCDISDFTWAIGYLFMITGDAKYADWVENAIFNAGLGAVDDDFKGEQYFSCPNQVLANDNCNHARFYRGYDWMSFAPKKFLGCCAGNVHRFMPNFAARAWMRDGDTLVPFTYTPTQVRMEVSGVEVTIDEDTLYPFENTVRFRVHTPVPVPFTLLLRRPAWATGVQLTVNGQPVPTRFKNRYHKLRRTFAQDDMVTLTFTDCITLVDNAKGVSVKKGPLLYALPVEEQVVVEGLRELGNKDFPRYSLYPASQWNYALCTDRKAHFAFVQGPVGKQPWRRDQNGMTITVTGRQIPDWKIKKVRRVLWANTARGRAQWADRPAIFTPKVRSVTPDTPLGPTTQLTLVPYGTTRLRIGIFPKL